MTTVAVVIPFYQREMGILAHAIDSVLKQDLPTGVRLKIIVVDDGSPIAAADELSEFHVPAPHELVLMRQSNGGPGAARNLALDNLQSTEVDFVAFLDSDDEWRPEHIRTALEALSDRRDFYFCDHTRFDRTESWFGESTVVREWRDGRRPAPVALADQQGTFVLSGTAAFATLLEEYLGQTSTVVYRFARHPSMRFDTVLRSAGEDHMFWLILAQQSEEVVFSEKANVACGRGVNICFSAFDWKKPEAAARHGYLLLFRLKLARQFDLDPQTAAMVRRQTTEDLETYAYLLARNAARGHSPDWTVLGRLAKISPAHAASLPLHLFWGMLRRRAAGSHLGTIPRHSGSTSG